MRYQKQILFLLGKQRHLRVEDIFESLKGQNPRLSVATVYRNVKQLETQGAVVGFLHPDGSSRYERTDGQHHQHLVCESCGGIIEITFGFMGELVANVRQKVNFHLHPHRLAMIGRCQQCNA